MRKLIVVSLLLFAAIVTNAQKKFLCEYSDTVITNIPDSILAEMLTSARPDIVIPEEVMKQFLVQAKAKPASMIQTRIVRAASNETIINIDRSSRTGNLTMETFDSLRYKNDEIYVDAPSRTGFADHPSDQPRKEFVATGKKISILSYQCDEYFSTDSTCYMWVTKELPDYINPGIRTGKIKAAVLGFQLNHGATITKTVLAKLEIVL